MGRALFRKELAQVLSTPVEELVKGSVQLGNKFRDYTLWYENYRSYFPKCKGYANLDTFGRLQLYKCFDIAQTYFQASSLMELSRLLTDVLYLYRHLLSARHCVELGLTFYQSYPDYIIKLVDSLYPYRSIPVDTFMTQEDWSSVQMSIYSQLLVSRIFCENCKILNVSASWYLQKIEHFYSILDYMHLTDWYESQSKYFDMDFADEGDIVYFYNNVDYDFESFKNSFAYRSYSCNVRTLAKQLIKHKIANDKNQMFVYG